MPGRDANTYCDSNTYGDSNRHTDSYTGWWNANSNTYSYSDTYRYAKSNAETATDPASAPNAPVRKPPSGELVIRGQFQS